MKHIKFIFISYPKGALGALKKLLASAGLVQDDYSIEEFLGSIDMRLPAEDTRTAKVIKALQGSKYDWMSRDDIRYDKKDILAAEFLRLGVNQAPKSDTGPAHGTEYDWKSGCSRCGTGARQVSPLRVKLGSPSKSTHMLLVGSGQILLSQAVSDRLLREFPEAPWLRQVEDRATGKPLSWFQLLPSTELQPMDRQLTLGLDTDDQCPKCTRDGFFHSAQGAYQPGYRLRTREKAKLGDVLHTWECFGSSSHDGDADRYLAQPDTVISNRVASILMTSKVSRLLLTPVNMVVVK